MAVPFRKQPKNSDLARDNEQKHDLESLILKTPRVD